MNEANEQKRGRLRWKRKPPSSGLLRMVEPTIHHYTDGVEVFATVQSLRRPASGWIWYGMGQNTSNAPVKTSDEAKLQAEQHVKARLAASIETDDGSPQ